MNYILYIAVMVFCVHTRAALTKDQTEYASTVYTIKQLVDARMRWVGHESRLQQLTYEASLASEGCLTYMSGGNVIAIFNAKDKRITTYLKDKQPITLSYQEFVTFFNDAKFILRANQIIDEKRARSLCKKVKRNFDLTLQ